MQIPKFMIPHLRTNHAGETGAVFIYKGILIFSRDKKLKIFAKNHLKTESEHLRLLNSILPLDKRSKLTFFWKICGFLTGSVPALISSKLVYITIFYVETFVEKHYQHQIDLLKESYPSLKKNLINLKGDEVQHKEEAFKQINSINFFEKFWSSLVTNGSSFAVKISKII
jgi:ubiquinone biosynthesis monooxygenase Coq7